MSATCIPENDLEQFVNGQLASKRLSEIAEHVDSCESCQDTVVALAENEDTLANGLRAAQATAPFEGEAALRQGLRRMVASMRKKPRSEEQTSDFIRQVGPYTLEEALGTGGMGTVYRAVHSKLKRDVAVKLLPAARWSNAAAISRFEREMEAIGQLDHPNIVRASDAGEDKGMHYLVMDYVDGLDLSRLTRRIGQLPVADACELARQTAEGLQYAHDNGLIHRDIKPSNLMLAKNGRGGETNATLRILDLGLALLGDEHLQDAAELTSVGQLMGTLDYMSPEQGIDSHGVDHRTDIYGLGATLFKLLTGRAPYADPRFGTLMKKMTALATKTAPSVAEFRDDLSPELVSIVDRMLARDPDERFGSAAKVAEALASFTRDSNLSKLLQQGLETKEPPQSKPVVVAPTRQSFAPESPVASCSAKPISARFRPRKWLIALAAAGAAAIAGIVIYLDTNVGNVVVRCDDPNAVVAVKRVTSGKTTSIEIDRGLGRQTVRAGEYVVEVTGDASYEISPTRFELQRKKEKAISVTRKKGETTTDPLVEKGYRKPNDANKLAVQTSNDGGYGGGYGGGGGDEGGHGDGGGGYGGDGGYGGGGKRTSAPTYGDHDFEYWADMANTSRDIRSLTQAFEAMAVLADDADMQSRAAELVCKSMRVHGGVHFGDGGGLGGGMGGFGGGGMGGGGMMVTPAVAPGSRHQLIIYGINAILRMGPESTIDVLAREAKKGNAKSKDFVRMVVGLALPSTHRPDLNEVRRFRKGLVENKDKFADGLVPNSVEVVLTYFEGQVFTEDFAFYQGMTHFDLTGIHHAVTNPFAYGPMETWKVQFNVIGDLDESAKAILEPLRAIAEMVVVKKTSLSEHKICKEEDIVRRMRRAKQWANDCGYHLDGSIDAEYKAFLQAAVEIVARETQYAARIKANGGNVDADTQEWRKEIDRLRKVASKMEAKSIKRINDIMSLDPDVINNINPFADEPDRAELDGADDASVGESSGNTDVRGSDLNELGPTTD